MMIRSALSGVFLSAVLVIPHARAGVFTDDMSKCLVRQSTAQDQVTLVKWMFAALSLNPAVAPLSAITPETRSNINKDARKLIERLLLKDCRNETVTALKNEGPASLQISFSVFGQSAARGLMSNAAVSAEMQGLGKSMSSSPEFDKLLVDAGLHHPEGFTIDQ